ncbi:MAG TPA: ferritin family protein [Flexilinea sp.]|jgi:rubrerythrin|nr:hypothetical protein [Flexilinea sp.]HNY94864.1 ferritin family protein [Flexilinea sp.]HOG22832.1 ferritin family protein [Flexilinea sp.]HOR56914.1 ferritin family protein [Flexilinea sp.]HOU20448.1 ferritin family protein [Flexilinea sp.]
MNDLEFIKSKKNQNLNGGNMGNLFNGAEFFEMMAANEKAVGDLYRFLAKDAKFGGKFFENMAADEDRHYGIYTSLLKKYQGKKDLMVELAEDRKSYMDLLIKNNYLSDPEKLKERAANAKSKEDIFDIAERIERDSVMFTQEMIDLFPDLDPADFKVVLQEEKKHLAMVLDKRMDSQLKSLRL